MLAECSGVYKNKIQNAKIVKEGKINPKPDIETFKKKILPRSKVRVKCDKKYQKRNLHEQEMQTHLFTFHPLLVWDTL